MDLLVMDRVLAALDGTLRGAVLLEVREEAEGRLRLLAATPGGRPLKVAVGLDPERPWLGRAPRPRKRTRAPRRPPTPFAAACARALEGAAVTAVERLGDDRIGVFRTSSGHALVAELVRGPTLVLLNPDGTVADAARRPRASKERLAAGAPYRPPALPAGRLPALRAAAEEVDTRVRALTQAGLALEGALRRALFGLAAETADLIAAEAVAAGTSPGRVLAARRAAAEPPCIVGSADPLAEAEEGRLDLEGFRLLPWGPAGVPCLRGEDAAETAGLFHEAAALAAGLRGRARALDAILRREIARLWEAEGRAREDAAGFADPDRYGRFGEALLAGLSVARRRGDIASVPDPYDPEGRTIEVPAPAHLRLADAAQGHFARQRRARRGIEGARRRQADLRARRERLEALAGSPASPSLPAVEGREAALRQEGIAVGLIRTPSRREPAGAPPRVEGVRLYSSSEGFALLVGRTGRDNARLTFKIAAPEDFWLHALGVPGAHVVVRNPERRKALPEATLREAAALAAWYSDAKAEAQADVQVARRKDVRAARGAPPGTVLVKRASTVRVRPELPTGVCEGGAG